jgi:hypothetical protein
MPLFLPLQLCALHFTERSSDRHVHYLPFQILFSGTHICQLPELVDWLTS